MSSRFTLRKVHLANIDRNNLRFTLHSSRGMRFRSKRGEIRRPRNNKILPLVERTSDASVRARTRKFRRRDFTTVAHAAAAKNAPGVVERKIAWPERLSRKTFANFYPVWQFPTNATLISVRDMYATIKFYWYSYAKFSSSRICMYDKYV